MTTKISKRILHIAPAGITDSTKAIAPEIVRGNMLEGETIVAGLVRLLKLPEDTELSTYPKDQQVWYYSAADGSVVGLYWVGWDQEGIYHARTNS